MSSVKLNLSNITNSFAIIITYLLLHLKYCFSTYFNTFVNSYGTVDIQEDDVICTSYVRHWNITYHYNLKKHFYNWQDLTIPIKMLQMSERGVAKHLGKLGTNTNILNLNTNNIPSIYRSRITWIKKTQTISFVFISILNYKLSCFEEMLIPLNAEGVYWCSAELLPATFYPFQTNVLFLYPLKMLENLWFSDVFRGYRNKKMAWKGLSFFTGHFGQLFL